ncbi:MAG: M48 family metallopeptidase [Desulfohalobiaceae bacterium]|nr:M48 family metallopeptidase [Desulfohalobiaceae bacterium]
MNIYLIVILVSVIGAYLLENTAVFLNVRHLDPAVPWEFIDVVDRDKYRRSQEYTRKQSMVNLFHSSVNLAIMLAFILGGGFAWLDGLVRTFSLDPVWTGLIFFAFLGIVLDLASLPFEIYTTFVLEEAFGFNRTTPGLFFKDKLKGYLLALVIGGTLLAGVLLFLGRYPDWGWLFAWSLVVLVMLLLHFLAPTLILPLFNTFTPLEDGELKRKIKAYAQRNGFDLSGIVVMDGSKRSTKSNAFFTGLGRKKRIALFDTLLERHEPDELVAVLAHEIGHYKKRHIQKNMILAIAKTGILLYLVSLFISHPPLFAAFGLNQPSVYAGLVFFALLYAPIALILSLYLNSLSRKFEYQADAFAAETTKRPENLIQALKRLSADNLSNLTPHPFYVFVNHPHPPVLSRIKALRRLETA